MKRLFILITLVLLFSCQKEERALQVSISEFHQEPGKVTFVATVIKGELPVMLSVNINESRTNIHSEIISLNSHSPMYLEFSFKGITNESGVWVYWTNKYSTGITGMKL